MAGPKSFFLTPEIHEYVVAHGTRPDAVQQALIDETAALPMAGMQISPEQGTFMTLVTRLVGARQAVEVGTFTGYSAISIARGLPDDGHLLCCDVSEEWTSIAQRYWERAGVSDRIELRIAPAVDTLRGLPAERSIDFAFIDADKAGYPAYYEEIVARTRPGGLIVLDNMLRDGRVLDPQNDDDRAIVAMNSALVADDRVDVVLLPVRDGVSLARVR